MRPGGPLDRCQVVVHSDDLAAAADSGGEGSPVRRRPAAQVNDYVADRCTHEAEVSPALAYPL